MSDADVDVFRQANESLHAAYHAMRTALIEIASVGDGYGARNQQSGTTGEGHSRCLAIADDALGIGYDDLPPSADKAELFWSEYKSESSVVI